MEGNILKILLEYKKVENSKKEFKKIFNEALTNYGFSEKRKGIIQSLDPTFASQVEPFIQEANKAGCTGIFTSGKREPGKLKTSYHIQGQALDLVPANDECYCKMLDICSRYKNLFCLDERKQITPDWTGPHLHISVKQKSGVTKACNPNSQEAKGTPAAGTNQTDASVSTGQYDSDFGQIDTGLFDVAGAIASAAFPKVFAPGKQAVTESLNFGRKTKKKFGEVIIPAESNNKILSPVQGKVITLSDPRCTNAIGIKPDNSDYTLKYCNIAQLKVSPGEIVDVGTIIGYLNENDVTLAILDISKRKVDPDVLDKEQEKTNDKPKNNTKGNKPKNYYDDDKDVDEYKSSYKSEPTFPDAGLAAVFQLPFLPFKNVYDKTGKLVKKNWGSPTEKRQPDKSSWFNSPTEKKQPESLFKKLSNKKLDENIERIKKLLN